MHSNGIGWAIKQMFDGEKVARSSWNNEYMYLAIQIPDENSKMSRPYIYMQTAEEELVPWIPSQDDLLADDWEVVVVE